MDLTARKTTERDADETLRELQRLGIEFIDADWTLTRAASALKSRHRMSYAGCFAAALARTRGANLATGDPEFKQVKDEIKILWR
jgi:predicted nucleic acid-binding protein